MIVQDQLEDYWEPPNPAHREAERLSMLGRPSQTLKRLVDLIHGTAVIETKLKSKFSPAQSGNRRSQLTAAALPGLPLVYLHQTVRSFAPGNGPGPDGLRVDFQ